VVINYHDKNCGMAVIYLSKKLYKIGPRSRPSTWTPSTPTTEPRSPGSWPSASAGPCKRQPWRPGRASRKTPRPASWSSASVRPSTALLPRASTTALGLPRLPWLPSLKLFKTIFLLAECCSHRREINRFPGSYSQHSIFLSSYKWAQ